MDYYISKNDGKYYGPFKKDSLIANGLDLDTLVWREGLPAWTQAKMLPELSDIIGDVPPPMEMTLGPSKVIQQPVQQPVQQPQQTNQEVDMQRQLEQLNHEKEELKKMLRQKKEQKLVEARKQKIAEKKEEKKIEEKKAQKEIAKNKKKTKYDHPVADWCNESIWLLGFVVCHALMAIFDWTTFEYLYVDIVGAVLSITGIIIGIKIRKLNKISYKKGSETRLKAEKLGYFNGFFVSTIAAIGFIIILIQSAHYVFVC